MEPTIDRKSKVPLYQQLFAILCGQIESGQLKTGDVFYSESELQQRYDVSRSTVREASRLLETHGYIRRSQGAPTVVAKEYNFTWDLYELTDDLKKDKEKLVSNVLSISKAEPSPRLRELLRLSAQDTFVYRIDRIRQIDDIKITRSVSHIVPWIGVDFTKIPFDAHTSIYETLEKAGQQAFVCDETLEATLGDDVTCSLLDLPLGSALFYRERLTYNQNKRPIEFVASHYNAKYTKYYVSNRLIKR